MFYIVTQVGYQIPMIIITLNKRNFLYVEMEFRNLYFHSPSAMPEL